ncbi:MAG: GNAT family N-acetyltransferase [Candidatus Latescibacterota bacterium]
MTRIEVSIRGERPGDEEAIDAVVSRAFGKMDEANLVRMLRDRQSGFDPDLSVCAWSGERLVGHTGLLPVSLRLLGRTVRAAVVAPVAVIPECQRQGIGAAMLAWGHRAAMERGIVLTFLNGHPGYYPRHGYAACFGFAGVTVDPERLPAPGPVLQAWPVRIEDIPWLRECDDREWREVDFSWPRGGRLSEWTIEGVNAVLWRTGDGRRAAYTLARAGQAFSGGTLDAILGDDPALIRQLLAQLRPARLNHHHPAGWLARQVLGPAWAICTASRSDAAMACPIQPGVLDEYLAAVESGRRLPGTTNWPIPFIMC